MPHFREPAITPPGYGEPGLFRLTAAERAQIDEDEAREHAGHAMRDEADDLAADCDQQAWRFRQADDQPEIRAITAELRALRHRIRRALYLPRLEG